MKNTKIGIIGLGYVGLPLAAAFANKFDVVGYDINTQRVKELKQCHDGTNELTIVQLEAVIGKGLCNHNPRRS